tara:strand:- start:330 stop:788 length:459 start_codon:yes stop_codon:yes gene_type:complete
MIKNLLLLFLFSLVNWNCRYANIAEAQNTEMFENIILTALKERTDLAFDNKTRDLHTIINDSSKFEHIFPNTNVSCGYIIRYFFHTNIHLGQESNKLISMNGRAFNIESLGSIEEKEYIINLTESVLVTIGNMYFGSSELQDFFSIYPDVVI